MADIKQAAQWLDEGKPIQTPVMDHGFLFRNGHRIRFCDGKKLIEDYELCMGDLLSDEWRIKV